MAKYKRVLLKLSGESLMGEKQYGIDEKRLAEYAAQIKEIHEQGVQIGIVIGGGNIFRGLSGANKGFDRVKGDQMGMLATVINSLALSSALVAAGVKARVLTAVRMEPIGEFYSKWKAIECMESVLYYRHRLIASRYRDRSRRHVERYSRRRYLYCRPGERSYGNQVPRHHLR